MAEVERLLPDEPYAHHWFEKGLGRQSQPSA